MDNIIENIREKSLALLENGQVEAVLGFSRGTLPMARRPFLAKNPAQVEQLYWDEFCLMNLANFIPPDIEGKIAIITKGCDWRNLVVHHLEGRIKLKDKVIILGMSCEGMLDPKKISLAAGGMERILKVACGDSEIQIQTIDEELRLEKKTLFRQACLECIQSSPLVVDDWVVQSTTKNSLQICSDIPDLFAEADQQKKEDQLGDMFKNCLMCFACRDACPLCYCNQCFVDVEKSHWLSTLSAQDTLLNFHFFRAHHIAGRCTGCGACESACPANIPVRQLVKKLNTDIEKSTGYVPGLNINSEPPTSVFRPSYHESFERQR